MTGRHVYGKFGEPDRFYLDGEEVTQARYDAAFPDQPIGGRVFGTEHTKGWPILTDALACLPSQVAEMTAEATKRGVPTEFMPDGRPIMRSSKHFREYCRKHGFRHKGY